MGALDSVGKDVAHTRNQGRRYGSLAEDIHHAGAVHIARDDNDGVKAAIGLVVELTGIGHGIALDGDKVVHVVAVQCCGITARLVDDGNLLGVAALVVEIGQPDGNGHDEDEQPFLDLTVSMKISFMLGSTSVKPVRW